MGFADLRKRKGLTQRNIEELCGVTAKTVCVIESGCRMPHISTIRKLAQAIGEEYETVYIAIVDGMSGR